MSATAVVLALCLRQIAVFVGIWRSKTLASKFSRLYYNIARLTKINFCIAFAICSLLNANNSRSLKYGVKKSLQANFFTYIIKTGKRAKKDFSSPASLLRFISKYASTFMQSNGKGTDFAPQHFPFYRRRYKSLFAIVSPSPPIYRRQQIIRWL